MGKESTLNENNLTYLHKKNMHIVRIIIVITFILLCIYTLVSYSTLYKESHKDAEDTATAELTLAATKIQDYMNRYRNVEEIMVGFTMAYKYSSKKEDEIETMYHSTVNGFRNSSENITNLYCYIDDKLIDGSGWVPDEDYNPKERQWYIKALENQGRSVYVLPYKDVITGEIVLTITKEMPDRSGVVALDVELEPLAEYVDDYQNLANGMAYVVDASGFVVTSSEADDVGKQYSGESEKSETAQMIKKVLKGDGKPFDVTIDDIEYRVFYREIEGTLIAVVLLNKDELFSKSTRLLVFSIATVLLITIIISWLIYRTYRSQEGLIRAKEEAEQASKSKTAFLFNMSHDIRTPMNAIIGFTHLALENKGDSEKLRDYLNNIDISSRKLLDILNSVLEVARIENNKVYLEEELNDMSHYYKDLLSMFDSQVQGKNLTIHYEQKMAHKYFYVDVTKLSEIIINLVSNAIKYTPDGGEISISSTEYPIEGKEDMVTVETIIEDNGIGMSEDFQNHLFENFSRERTEATDGIQGTGLGLAIVKKLVEIMNGTIEVESELGKGSKFIIRLPHRFGNMPDNAKTEQEDDKVSTEIFKGKRILLAEDNELNAEIAKAVLQDVGFIVEHAADGVICVDMYKNAEPGYYDMILMDIQMPNMNGYKATHYIRSMEDKVKANIPIIAMTANAFKEDVENVINAGMNGHIAKPLERDKMFRTLADALK